MSDCVFCQIVSKKIPAHSVYEDETCIAFLDINPVRPGHTLVIPKQHFEMLPDVPEKEGAHLMKIVQRLMPALKTALKADYVVVSVVGIDVPHAHIHLIPRHHTDGLAGFWPRMRYSDGEEAALLERIRTVL